MAGKRLMRKRKKESKKKAWIKLDFKCGVESVETSGLKMETPLVLCHWKRYGSLGIVTDTIWIRQEIPKRGASDARNAQRRMRWETRRRSLEAPRALEAATRVNLMKKVGWRSGGRSPGSAHASAKPTLNCGPLMARAERPVNDQFLSFFPIGSSPLGFIH